MLLTGFDAPRLKRLYFGRKLKDHNLLQALTRVNRPYENNFYGYVIDFADIKKNFDETNEAYLKELNRFMDPAETGDGNTMDTINQILESPEKLVEEMREIRQVLFNYTIDNVEDFSSELSTIEDKEELLKLKKVLISAKDLCNIVRTFGDEELKQKFERLEITKLPSMISEVSHCIDIINQKEIFSMHDETNQIINRAMEDIEFSFKSISKEEMKIISGGIEINEKWKKTINEFANNFDQDDPEYITLREAFMQRFKEHGFVIDSIKEFNEQSEALDAVLKRLAEIKKKNTAILRRYNGDTKFARLHKRIKEENERRKMTSAPPIASEYDEDIVDVLNTIKRNIDSKVYDRNDILKKDAYFEQVVMKEITDSMNKMNFSSNREDRAFIQFRVSREYLDQYNSYYKYA